LAASTTWEPKTCQTPPFRTLKTARGVMTVFFTSYAVRRVDHADQLQRFTLLRTNGIMRHHPIAGLRDRLGFFWASGIPLIALLLAAVSAMLAFFAQPDYGQKRHDGALITATISGISGSSSKYAPYLRTMTITDSAGTDYHLTTPVDMIAGCKIGDSIVATSGDLGLALQPMSCRRIQTKRTVR
jgi:hypothetical protein